MDDHERRQALADFLRKRRAGLTPADVGLSPGVRRRTPGLRREEVAQLANMGVSWYVWLEQGRDVHPSVEVLESLAGALQLTPNERRHLFLLAQQSPPPATSPATSANPQPPLPLLQQIVDALDPSPAYVLDRHWDCLAWNDSAELIFRISSPSQPHGQNLIWRFFTDPALRALLCNWEQMVRGVQAEYRAACARFPEDEWFPAFTESLQCTSPEFARWWTEHDAPRALDGDKFFTHPTLGHLTFQHLTLQVVSNPELKLTLYTPDAVTLAKLQANLDGVGPTLAVTEVIP